MAQAFLRSDPDQAARTVGPVQLGSPNFDEAEAIRTLSSMVGSIDEARDCQRAP